MNGRLYNDTNIGEYTYESELGKSVIDLLICKPSSIQMINKFSILPLRPTESDHKPIVFSLMLPPNTNNDSPVNEGTSWNPLRVNVGQIRVKGLDGVK